MDKKRFKPGDRVFYVANTQGLPSTARLEGRLGTVKKHPTTQGTPSVMVLWDGDDSTYDTCMVNVLYADGRQDIQIPRNLPQRESNMVLAQAAVVRTFEDDDGEVQREVVIGFHTVWIESSRDLEVQLIHDALSMDSTYQASELSVYYTKATKLER